MRRLALEIFSRWTLEAGSWATSAARSWSRYPVRLSSGKTIRSAPESAALAISERWIARLRSRSPSAGAICARTAFIGGDPRSEGADGITRLAGLEAEPCPGSASGMSLGLVRHPVSHDRLVDAAVALEGLSRLLLPAKLQERLSQQEVCPLVVGVVGRHTLEHLYGPRVVARLRQRRSQGHATGDVRWVHHGCPLQQLQGAREIPLEEIDGSGVRERRGVGRACRDD